MSTLCVMLIVAMYPWIFSIWDSHTPVVTQTSFAICSYSLSRMNEWHDGVKNSQSFTDSDAFVSALISMVGVLLIFMSRLANYFHWAPPLAKFENSFDFRTKRLFLD